MDSLCFPSSFSLPLIFHRGKSNPRSSCFVSIINPERKDAGGMIGTTRQGGCKDQRAKVVKSLKPNPNVTRVMATTQYRELSDAADFDYIALPDGYVSICGFGSLLSERSARSTFPNLQSFRVAVLRGFRRVFAHTAPIFFERGIARMETKEISSLSVEPCPGEFIIVTVFEIHKSEVAAFIERENEFRFLVAVPEDLSGKPFSHPSVVCSRYSDEEYHLVRCKGSEEMFFQRYGRHNIDKIWRDDILPCRVYLRHCVLAAKNLGEMAHNNFLDHTFLGDRKTCIRQYFSAQGSGIMEEEPPEALKERYGG